jgi:pimeloyl-ACP methyl ester carboxylesterase
MPKSSANLRRLSAAPLLLFIFCQNFAVFAQAKKTGGAPKSCSGAWTGIVNYSKRQTVTNNKTVERVSARGEDKTNFEMKLDYKAQVAVLESPEKNSMSVGRATINSALTSIETVSAVEKNSCDRGKTWRDMRGESVSKTETIGSGRDAANVNVGVNEDGTYSVSVGLPRIAGKVSGSQSSTYSGQCTPKEGKNLNLPSTATEIQGESLTSDGTTRLNPSDPNRISGSYSLTSPGDAVETISWNLQKCGAPLRLVDVQFEDMRFPTWNDWREISEQKGTIDGNLVKIKAKILNASPETKFADIKFKETFQGDKWDGARPDGVLENGETSVRAEANDITETEMIWNSSGYAWFDDGRPRLVQRIKAELSENNKKTDELTRNLKVAPKPLVLVHGLWSNWKAWESWQNILTTAHSYDWKAFPVGEKPEKGLMNTGGSFLSTSPTNSIFENSQQLGKYIKYAQEDRNAWHVDIVAHSMGGLISRHYIHQFMPANYADGRPQIAHLVMLGTPNMGSPCADVMNTAFEALGKNVEAVRQLRQDVAEEFNRVNVNRKGVKFSVLAGNPLPTMCKQIVWNDGVVPVPSAIWKIKDSAQSKNVHTELTGTEDFSAFVKPRRAVGPTGNHNPEAPELPGTSAQTGQSNKSYNGAMFLNAAYKSDAFAPGESFSEKATTVIAANSNATGSFARAVKIAPKQTIEIEIPVEAARSFGLTFMADARVSATLFDEKGAVAGKNLTKTPESVGWFRSIFVDRETAQGVWKLKLENAADTELEIVLTTWKDAAK